MRSKKEKITSSELRLPLQSPYRNYRALTTPLWYFMSPSSPPALVEYLPQVFAKEGILLDPTKVPLLTMQKGLTTEFV